jgi:hypothetical protein
MYIHRSRVLSLSSLELSNSTMVERAMYVVERVRERERVLNRKCTKKFPFSNRNICFTLL